MDQIFPAGDIVLGLSCFVYWFPDVLSAVKRDNQYDGKYIYGFLFTGGICGIICMGDGLRPVTYEQEGFDHVFPGGGSGDVSDLFFL